MTEYIVCADGACSGNPGPGGFAYAIWQSEVAGTPFACGDGYSFRTTNNIMELTAAYRALGTFVIRSNLVQNHPLEPGRIRMRLDSEYVLKGMFEWMHSWKRRGWKTASRKPVANQKLWQDIDSRIVLLKERGFTLTPDWVKGHSGDPGNEFVNREACKMRDIAMERQVDRLLGQAG